MDIVRKQLAPSGTLKVGINLSNILLVTDKADDGTPVGVAPDMAKALAKRLGVPLSFKTYPQAGLTADGISQGEVAVGLIAIEPERAKTIGFSAGYCEIEGTFLVPNDSSINSIEDVDQPNIRIAVANRAAYDLYLSRTLKHAELVRGTGLPGAVEVFKTQGLNALAGLRPALNRDSEKLQDTRVLDGNFTTIQQAIGTQPENTEARAFINEFISEAKSSGLVQEFLDLHHVANSLKVAADTDT